MSKYKIPYILKWQYALASPIESKVLHAAGTSTAVVTNYHGVDIVTRKYFIKWWDNFQCSRVEEMIKNDHTLLKEPNIKQVTQVATKASQPIIKPSDPSDMKNLTSEELQAMVQALLDQLSQKDQDFIKQETSTGSQDSTASSSSQPVYSREEFQDAQDPYAS